VPPFAVWRDTLLAVLVVSAVPVLAVTALAWDADRVRRLAPPLVCVAAGALAGAALFHLIPEGYEAAAARGWSLLAVPALVAAGAAVFALLEWALHGAHGHHDAGGGHAAAHRAGALAALTVVGDGLHNLIDGALIAATFLAHPAAGAFATLAVALHEVPRELGSFGVLVHGGLSPRQALALNTGTALLAGAGAVGTLALGPAAARAAHALLPFAAGNFLYVAVALLLPLLATGGPPGARRRRAALASIGLAVAAGPRCCTSRGGAPAHPARRRRAPGSAAGRPPQRRRTSSCAWSSTPSAVTSVSGTRAPSTSGARSRSSITWRAPGANTTESPGAIPTCASGAMCESACAPAPTVMLSWSDAAAAAGVRAAVSVTGTRLRLITVR
jgi:zinc and cadmium transporter